MGNEDRRHPERRRTSCANERIVPDNETVYGGRALHLRKALGERALAERWNGTSWSVQTTPEPEHSYDLELKLLSVSCSESSACTAVGSYDNTHGHGKEPLIERWSGTEWKLEPSPSPTGHSEAEETAQWELTGVACPAYGCVTVGSYDDSREHERPAAWRALERGTLASHRTSREPRGRQDPNNLTEISCPSTSICMGVGYTEKTGGARKHF